MSANDANLKGAPKGQDASEVNEAPQAPSEKGINSDIKFNSADIGKKERTEYFVRVEGDEEKKKAAEKEAAAERKAAEKEAAIAKKAADEAKKEADRIAKEDAAFLKREERKNACRNRRQKIATALFGGKRKFLTIGILLLVVAGVIGGILFIKNLKNKQEEGKLSELEEKAYVDRSSRYLDYLKSWRDAEDDERKSEILADAFEYYESIEYGKINRDTAIVSLVEYCDLMATMGSSLQPCIDKMIENKGIADTKERQKVMFGELKSRCLNVGNYECVEELKEYE